MEAKEQAGFRVGIDDRPLFSVSQVIEKRTSHNQETHLIYADVKEAYDSVS